MSIAGEELADGDADLGDHRGGPSREEPLAREGIQEGALPKCSFRGRQSHNWVPDSGSSPQPWPNSAHIRAGTMRMCCTPVPHAKSENVRPARRLSIEATVNL